jgi:hypothetical protein
MSELEQRLAEASGTTNAPQNISNASELKARKLLSTSAG